VNAAHVPRAQPAERAADPAGPRRRVDRDPFAIFGRVVMTKHTRAGVVAAAAAFALLLPGSGALAASVEPLGVRFEENAGQTDPRVRFVARGGGQTLFLTDREAVVAFRRGASGSPGFVRISLAGAESSARPEGEGRLPGTVNYLLGRSGETRLKNVACYGRVRYAAVYPGVDLVYHGGQGALEYDFRVAPGADPGRIALSFDGARAIRVDANGDLVLSTAAGEVVQRRPVAYQELEGVRQPVEVGYTADGARIRFSVGPYDADRPLVIDPVLAMSSYLGGSLADSGTAVAVDSAGNWYVAGQTASLDFPVTAGAAQPLPGGGSDAFVARIDPSGTSLMFATYIGGSSSDVANGVAVDAAGNVYVAGETASADFPTTAGAVQTALFGRSSGFVTKLDPSGSTLLYSTYFGGSSTARCDAIAVDGTGAAYVVGRTDSTDLPTTPGVLYPTYRGGQFDAYLAKLDPSGAALAWSTFVGGNDKDALFGVALGPGNTVCVAGGSDSPDYPTTASAYQGVVQDTDPVVTKFGANATQLLYSTYLGGSLDRERANAIAADASGFLYVTGFTPSADFPVVHAAQAVKGAGYDGWAARLDPNASGAASLVYSTFLGGAGDDRGDGIAVDGAGNAYIVGSATDGAGFPLVDPVQAAYGGGASDAFAVRLSPTGAFLYSTFLGGSGADQARGVVAAGNTAFFAGATDSTNFPTVSPLQAVNGGGSDAFFARIQAAAAPGAAVPTLSPRLLLLFGAALAVAGGLLLRRA
jgi:hypothetical protein